MAEFSYKITRMEKFLKKAAFLMLSSIIVVFFSEKSFWYIQGYTLLELYAAYSIPTFFFLWALDAFQVNTLHGLFLASAVFGFIVEGILTPVLYEFGPFDLFQISYTSLGWHAVISAFFGWYFIHKWLVEGKTRQVRNKSALFGFFWGLWSLVFWMPENVTDAQYQTPEFTPGQWPIGQFVLFTFAMALIMAAAHWMIGKIWERSFKPGKPIVILFTAGGLFMYIFSVLLSYPWSPLKFAAVMLPTLYFLKTGGHVEGSPGYLEGLARNIALRDLAQIAFMPLMASAVYAAAYLIQIPEDIIALISAIPGTYGLMLLGWAFWIWAMLAAYRQHRKIKLS